MASLYKLPTLNIASKLTSLPKTNNLLAGKSSAFRDVGVTSDITAEEKKRLLAEGWTPDPTSYAINWKPTGNEPEQPYSRLVNPEYNKFKTLFSGLGENYKGINPNVVFERGEEEWNVNYQNWQKNLEKTRRQVQENQNWISDSAGQNPAEAAKKQAQIDEMTKQYNTSIEQFGTAYKAAFGEDLPLEQEDVAGFQDVSAMAGGTYSATPNAAAGQPAGMTPAQVEEWRAGQGQPTTAEMQAPGYVAPPNATSTPGANPTGTPTTPAGTPTGAPVAPTGAPVADRKLGSTEYQNLVKEWTAAGLTPQEIEANFLRRDAQGGISLRGDAPSTESILSGRAGGIAGAPSGVGAPSGAMGTMGTQGATDMAGGINELFGKESTTAPGSMGEFLGKQTQDTRDFYKSMLGTLGEQENAFLENYLNQPSTADRLKQLRDEQGLPQLEKEIDLMDKQILDTEGLLTKLEGDITERTKGMPVSEAARRRMLALEGKPLTEQLDELVRARTRVATGLSSKESVINQILTAEQEDRNLKLKGEEMRLGFAKEQLGTMTELFNQEQAQELEAFKADLPNVQTMDIVNELGETILMGYDSNTGEVLWEQNLGTAPVDPMDALDLQLKELQVQKAKQNLIVKSSGGGGGGGSSISGTSLSPQQISTYTQWLNKAQGADGYTNTGTYRDIYNQLASMSGTKAASEFLKRFPASAWLNPRDASAAPFYGTKPSGLSVEEGNNIESLISSSMSGALKELDNG